jgi:mannosyltransferase OCH1-like enzyme
MIPKHIYQTWKTHNLPPGIANVIHQMLTINPGWTHNLYDDTEMAAFIQTNYPGRVSQAFNSLAIGAARADIWRYCVLYHFGGVYLDIDADICKPLDTLIRQDDDAIITREQVEGLFNQWILIFSRGHPLLKAAIDECVENVLSRSSNNILHLTGSTVFSQILTHRLKSNQLKHCDERGFGGDLWHSLDGKLEELFNQPGKKYRCRFYGIDMNEYARYHNSAFQELYQDTPQWETEQRQKSIFISGEDTSNGKIEIKDI